MDDAIFARLASFQGIHSVSNVDLKNSLITDNALIASQTFPEFVGLGLANTQVTAAGLAHLRNLPNRGIMLIDCKKVDDEACAVLGSMPRFQWMSLAGTTITDAGVAKLAACKELRLLDVRRCKISEATVKKLAAALPRCQITWDGGVIEPKESADIDRNAAEFVLSIGGKVRIDDQPAELSDPRELPPGAFRLTGIDLIDNNRQLTASSFAVFHGTKNLKELHLDNASNITDAALANFQDNKKLTLLGAFGAQVSAVGLEHFRDCPDLHALFLGNSSFNDQDMEFFKTFSGLPRLTALYLNATSVTDKGLSNLEGAEKLIQLNLDRTKVTDAGLQGIGNFQHLNILFLSHTAVSDAGLAHLRKCVRLKKLSLLKTKVTSEGVADLQRAIPGCQITWDGGVIEPKE